MNNKNFKEVSLLFSVIFVLVILVLNIDSVFAITDTETTVFDSTYSTEPTKYILTEITFPKGQAELASEITKLFTLGETNPKYQNMVNISIKNLKPLMLEKGISLVSDQENKNEIQIDYHKTKHTSLYNYQVTAWIEYPCQGHWLNCKSNTNNNNIDAGTTFSTRIAIENNPTGEDLQFHHKIKNTSGYTKKITSYHFGSFMNMDQQMNVGCSQPKVHTLNYVVNQSHDIRFCILQGIEQGDRADLSMHIR